MTEIQKILNAFHTDCHFNKNVLIEVFSNGTSMRRNVCWGNYTQYCTVRLETQGRPSWFPFFLDNNGLNSICDYIIFVEDSNSVHVLLFELKSGDESPIPQLDYTENFIKFILRHMNLNKKLRPDKKYFIRKIGITDKPQPKNSTKMSTNLPSFDENCYCKFYNSTRCRIDYILSLPIRHKNKGNISLTD